VPVPAENVELLREHLGLDVETAPAVLRAVAAAHLTTSISASPFPSPQMLKEYVEAGFADLPDRIIGTIDRQTQHRQALERQVTEGSERRQNSAQRAAQILGLAGLLASLTAGYLQVPAWICIAGILVSIGGPNAATVIARFVDKAK
jgi:uncharacterized membrane protein